ARRAGRRDMRDRRRRRSSRCPRRRFADRPDRRPDGAAPALGRAGVRRTAGRRAAPPRRGGLARRRRPRPATRGDARALPFGIRPRRLARLLDHATGGWTAAAVLAASRSKQTATPLRELAGLGGDAGRLSQSVGLILDELLAALGPDRRRAQIAPLPPLD